MYILSSKKHTKFSLQKVFRFYSNCMISVTVVAEIRFKLFNQRALSTGEPCTCEYVTLLQSLHRGPLSIHWYIAQSFSMSDLFRRSSKTAMFSRLLKVTIATSEFINEVCNGGFLPDFSVSMLKLIIALVWDYV